MYFRIIGVFARRASRSKSARIARTLILHRDDFGKLSFVQYNHNLIRATRPLMKRISIEWRNITAQGCISASAGLNKPGMRRRSTCSSKGDAKPLENGGL